MACPAEHLNGIPSGFGEVLPSGRRGPADVAAGQLLDPPAGVLLGPVVVAAGRVPITKAGPAARFVRDIVLEVRARRRAAAAWPGAASRAGPGPGAGAGSRGRGPWPRAGDRSSPVGIGSRAMSRSRCPGVPVAIRQVPYPPGGPGWSVAVKLNDGPPGGSRPSASLLCAQCGAALPGCGRVRAGRSHGRWRGRPGR